MNDIVIYNLMGMKHILDLMESLFSLGFIKHVDYKFQRKGEILKVSKRALTLMKAKGVGTL